MNAWLARTRALLRQPDFLGLLASTATLGLAFSFVSPFLSLWGTTEVGLAPWQFGLFMTVTSFSAICISTVLARWSDVRVPRKHMLLLGGAGGALGYAGYALIRQPWVLLAIGITAIAVASICFSQLFASVRERFAGEGTTGREAGVTLSIVRVCFSFSWTLGPAMGATLMASVGFGGLFLAAAGLYALFLIGVMRFVPLQPRPPQLAEAVRVPVARTLRRPDLLACFVAFVLVFSAFAMNMMNLPLAVSQLLGGTARDFGIIFGIGPVVEIPLMLWFGQLATRGHGLRLIRFGALAGVLYFVGLTFAQEPWHVYFIQILSGVVFAIITNVAIVFFQDLIPGQAGLATTLFSNASQLGNLLGFFGFGALSGLLGPRGLFVAGGFATLLTLLILIAYRPHPAPAPAVATA